MNASEVRQKIALAKEFKRDSHSNEAKWYWHPPINGLTPRPTPSRRSNVMDDADKICGCGCGKTKSIVISEIMSGPTAYNREQAEDIFDSNQPRKTEGEV